MPNSGAKRLIKLEDFSAKPLLLYNDLFIHIKKVKATGLGGPRGSG